MIILYIDSLQFFFMQHKDFHIRIFLNVNGQQITGHTSLQAEGVAIQFFRAQSNRAKRSLRWYVVSGQR